MNRVSYLKVSNVLHGPAYCQPYTLQHDADDRNVEPELMVHAVHCTLQESMISVSLRFAKCN